MVPDNCPFKSHRLALLLQNCSTLSNLCPNFMIFPKKIARQTRAPKHVPRSTRSGSRDHDMGRRAAGAFHAERHCQGPRCGVGQRVASVGGAAGPARVSFRLSDVGHTGASKARPACRSTGVARAQALAHHARSRTGALRVQRGPARITSTSSNESCGIQFPINAMYL
jgi:hypothetical protein